MYAGVTRHVNTDSGRPGRNVDLVGASTLCLRSMGWGGGLYTPPSRPLDNLGTNTR
jgi:hypothetical protein